MEWKIQGHGTEILEGDEGQVGDSISSDRKHDFTKGGRRPYASINYVTAHDGFTLNDLVSYNNKHNEGNKEDNKDGTDENLSWNGGIEGATDDPVIIKLRERQKRNFLATLILAQGVPMLLSGDESGRTQLGNNNAYCQDNKISWINWNLDIRGKKLLEFTRSLIALFHSHPVLQRRNFFSGRDTRKKGTKDLTWLHPEGREMTEKDWNNPMVRYLGLKLSGDVIEEIDDHGAPVIDDTLLILLNAHYEPVIFSLPECERGQRWELILDTRYPVTFTASPLYVCSGNYDLETRSLALLRLKKNPPSHRLVEQEYDEKYFAGLENRSIPFVAGAHRG